MAYSISYGLQRSFKTTHMKFFPYDTKIMINKYDCILKAVYRPALYLQYFKKTFKDIYIYSVYIYYTVFLFCDVFLKSGLSGTWTIEILSQVLYHVFYIIWLDKYKKRK